MPQTAAKPEFAASLKETVARVGVELDHLLSPRLFPGERQRPERLLAAMRHALLSGGKRFRPFLVVECARLAAPASTDDGLWRVAAAVECLHTYSLIHDDLPAMDDDDLRRGKPTVHRAFDEATAILAGDALLTLAFDVLAHEPTHADPAVRAELVAVLARACGLGGMAGGQMLDLSAENLQPDCEGIRNIQIMKTGALFSAACKMGALWAGGDAMLQETLSGYGAALGLAFQIADDLIDVEASAQAAGKATGKDARRGKPTFVSVLGADGARKLLAETVADCLERLANFGEPAAMLAAAAEFAAWRKN